MPAAIRHCADHDDSRPSQVIHNRPYWGDDSAKELSHGQIIEADAAETQTEAVHTDN
jgi:hypothetical protein